MLLYGKIYILLLLLFCMKRITVSLKLDEDTWKKVKHECIDSDMEYSSFVEEALKDKLKKNK